MSEAKTSKKIDWNDPSVIRYHTLKMKPKTVAQARRNMIKYLKNQGNYKISDFKGITKKMKSPEKIEEEDVATQKEMKEVSKESGAKERSLFLEKAQGTISCIIKSLEEMAVSKNYKVLSEMLEDFDRQDVEELYRLVKERIVLQDLKDMI
ncbi:hypothetical protein Tco_0428844 [Tanacetum coccineum]